MREEWGIIKRCSGRPMIVCLGEMVRKIREETRSDPTVVATGGLTRLIASASQAIHEVDEFLTLKELKIIYQRNLPRKK